MKSLLTLALVISLITYGFWESFPKGSFYYGNALFILLICLYIFLINRKSFICFLLLCYAINNLADELLFEPGVLGWNEIVYAVAVPLLWTLKIKWYARQVFPK